MVSQKEKSLRIALITDLHTGLPEEGPFAVDLRKNFTSVLNALKKHQPDELFIAGDLCLKDGDTDVYNWQRQHLDNLELPYHIIAGNHDDVKLMSATFDLPPLVEGELYYEKIFGRQRIIFLDTSQGQMSESQKRWLAKRLRTSEEHRSIIIMHHPPDTMNVPHMDELHFLQDKEEVMEILINAAKPISIFCGHYHVEKTMSIGQINVHITPSCYFQIDTESAEFRIAHKQIAYRIIDLFEDRIEHGLFYLPGHEITSQS